MNTEQELAYWRERAAFEEWFTKTKAYIDDPKHIIAQVVKDIAWEAWQARAAPQPAEPDKQHPDDVAVDAFAAAMKAKLKRAREEKGRGGWQDMSVTELSVMLREHVEKGDPVDVANLAMMLHQNGQGITPAEPVKVNAIFETQDGEVIGKTDAKVKRVECQDDGSLTVVIDYWPQPTEPVKRKRPYAQGTALGEFGVIPMCDQYLEDEPVTVPRGYALIAEKYLEEMIGPELMDQLAKREL